MDLFPPHNGSAPRHAFRGKARYFRKVQRTAEEFELSGMGSWFDFWHYHADWPGWGNLKWSYRREHLRALCTVFAKIAAAQGDLPEVFQSWIFISLEDAGQDATYIHTPNPNGSPFPFKPDNVEWGVPSLERFLVSELGTLELRVGRSRDWEDWGEPPKETTNYFAYVKGVGVPLE